MAQGFHSSHLMSRSLFREALETDFQLSLSFQAKATSLFGNCAVLLELFAHQAQIMCPD